MVEEAPLWVRKIAQYPDEAVWFEELLRREQVKSYLEIGSRHGGSLWRYGNALPHGSRLVAVDMPIGETLKPLKECVEQLKKLGYDVHLHVDDSRSTVVVDKVRKLGPFDIVLIDGDHSRAAIRKDWQNYGPMARMVAFHDIAWKRPADWSKGKRIDVPEVWEEIKGDYRHEEIRLDPTGQDNGIGVLWRSPLPAGNLSDFPESEGGNPANWEGRT
jgi:predicted O-methyltransferase YrrM